MVAKTETSLGSQLGRWILLAALVVALGALLLTIRPVGAQSTPMSVNYPENSDGPVGSPVYAQDPERRGVNWRVEGTDAEDFMITTSNNAGTLRFKEVPNFEAPHDSDMNNLYSVSVRAVDPGGRVSAARSFTVLVTNVEETGEVIVSHNGDEPWYGGLQPKVGVELFAYATDPDDILDDVGTTADDVTWQWYRGDQSSTTCSDTVSDNCLIEGADESAYIPVVGDIGMRLTAAASYFDKENSTMRKSAASKSMYATRAAGANKLPTFEQDQTSLPSNAAAQGGYGSDINTLIDLMPLDTAGTANDVLVQLEIKEDASVGDMVGPGPIAATDPDEGDELTYSIENTTAPTDPAVLGPVQFFAIDRATGQITLKKMVNTEATGDPCGTEDQCLVTVTATDSSGLPADGDDAGDEPDHVQINVRIDIIDVNEPPKIQTTNAASPVAVVDADTAVSVNENTTDVDALIDVTGDASTTGQQNYTASDVDLPAQTLTWTLTGADAALFGFGAPAADLTATPHPDTVTGTTGDLQFTMAPDFEDPKDANKDNTYEVTLNVSDGTNTATLDVKVTVKNLVIVTSDTDRGTVPTDLTTGVQEEVGTVTLSHRQPRVGVPITATLKDDDGGMRSQSWQWFAGTSEPAADATNHIHTTTGGNTSSYTPNADDVTVGTDTLYARVTYLDSTSEDQTQTRTVTAASTSVVAGVLDPPNRSPNFADDRYAREVEENATTEVTNPVSGGDAFIAVTDEDTGDEVQFSISGGDSEYFSVTNNINLQAVITPKSALDYEAPKDADRNNIYVFTLTVTDSSRATDTATVSVTVTDATETLTANTDASTMRVAENSPLRTNVGDPIQPTDPGDSTYQTYALNDATANSGHSDYFRIHRDDGQIYVNKELDFEATPTLCAANVCSVTVTITGLKTDDEGNSVIVGTAITGAIAITITDVNEAPSYSGTQTRYVAENAWKLQADDSYERDMKTGKPATLGSTLVAVTADDSGSPPGLDMDLYRTTATTGTGGADDRVAATDQDERVITDVRAETAVTERLLYTLSGPDAMYFGIYRGTGQIISQAVLDYESGKTEFTVMVTATDQGGLMATTEVTINLVDVNEPPEPIDGLNISDGPSEANYAEDRTDAVGTYVVEGIGADTANWSVEDTDDGSLFMVAPASGNSTMLSFRSRPDYEMPRGQEPSATNTNVYMVTVKATDSTDNTVSDTMTVMVTVVDADDTGMVTGVPTSAMVGDVLTAMLEDEDTVTREAWQWHRSADGVSFTPISGEISQSYTVADADGGMYLKVTLEYDDAHGNNKSLESGAVMVSQDVVSMYDDNPADGQISIAELFDAIDDYFDGQIEISELFEVIDAYFGS